MRIFKIFCAAVVLAGLVAGCKGAPSEGLTYTISNENGMKAVFCTTGGRLLSLEVPAKDGTLKNVLWGCADAAACAADADYRQCIVGRYGNRIARGRFDLDGYTWQLTCNEGLNHLHGGVKGFDKREWTIDTLSSSTLMMTLSETRWIRIVTLPLSQLYLIPFSVRLYRI